uniref:Uncharacterized protein n=1 Tax=Steinernema glaseri TaxID=37863 RepID=A0A1I8ALW6_9BILA
MSSLFSKSLPQNICLDSELHKKALNDLRTISTDLQRRRGCCREDKVTATKTAVCPAICFSRNSLFFPKDAHKKTVLIQITHQSLIPCDRQCHRRLSVVVVAARF